MGKSKLAMGESYVSVAARELGKVLYFCESIKEKESGEVLLYRHKQLGNYVVVKKLRGIYPAYERLVGVKQEHLPLIYEACHIEEETMILEEFIPGITIAERLEQETLSESYVKEIISRM